MADGFLPPEWEEAMRRWREAMRNIPQIPQIPQVPQIPKETLEAWTRAGEAARANIETIGRNFANLAIPALETWQFQIPRFEGWSRIADQMADIARRWQREFAAMLPANWAELDNINVVLGIVENMRDSNLCLVWLPRAAILREILDARPTSAHSILLAHRDEVLEDASAVLDQGAVPDFARERDAMRDVIAAMRAGNHRAAQALAAAVFTSTCHVLFNHGGTGAIAKNMRATDPMDAAIAQLRIRCIFMTSATALEKFNPVAAKPAFRHFNRHSSLHRITEEQYNEGAALGSIVLVAALLREVDEWTGVLPSDGRGRSLPDG